MSLDLRTVPQRHSFCNCKSILKDFHDFRDFHELPRILRSKTFQKKLPLLPFQTFRSITVNKSCRHRMYLHSKIPSSFLHSHSHPHPLFPISVDEIPSLLPQRKSPTYAQEVIYHNWHASLVYNSGTRWELITPKRTMKSKVSEANTSVVKTWHSSMTTVNRILAKKILMRRCSTLEELVKLKEIYEVYLNYALLNCIRNQSNNQ